MAKTAPYFPFYVDDWLDDEAVFDMGLECEGAYIRLLAVMWKKGGFVNDKPGLICNLLRIKPAKWKKIRAVLVDELNVFYAENGRLLNERLSKELSFFTEKSQKNTNSANSRWNKKVKTAPEKPNKNNESTDANALPVQSHSDTDTDTDTDTDKKNKQKNEDSREQVGEINLAGEFDQVWPLFDNRVNKKKALAQFQKLKPDKDLIVLITGALNQERRWRTAVGLFGAENKFGYKPNGEAAAQAHPERWIRDERWTDETPEIGNGKQAEAEAGAARHHGFTEVDYGIGASESDVVADFAGLPSKRGGSDGSDSGREIGNPASSSSRAAEAQAACV